MKDKVFFLRLKASSPIFLEKLTLVLHKYLFMVIPVFHLNLTPTYSIHLLTTSYPRIIKQQIKTTTAKITKATNVLKYFQIIFLKS